MLFSLFHSFLLFFCVVLVVRMAMPSQYALLNPYAATLDNLLTRFLQKLHPALPLPPKTLCGVLLVLALCADAVMLSRLGMNRVPVNLFTTFVLPAETFQHWLLIAVLGLYRHFLMIFAATLVLQMWHRSRILPGYSGDLLRLAVLPAKRLPIVLQWGLLFVGALLLAFLLYRHAESVLFPFEELRSTSGWLGEVANSVSLSTFVTPLQLITVAGLLVLDVISELHGFTVTLILFALVSMLTRTRAMASFITDVFGLLKGPLPEFRVGAVYLTPVLIVLVLAIAGAFFPAVWLVLIEAIASAGGLHVV